MRFRWLAVLAAAVGAVVATGCAPPAGPTPPAAAVPILFVHGHSTSSAVFDPMIEHLVQLGYPADYLMAVDMEPNNGPNAHAAEADIAPAVRRLIDRTGGAGGGKVDIVAHSMGGVSSRWYAGKLEPERVRNLVTIAGANHGTDGLCGLDDPGAREMCPAYAVGGDHAVQVGLNGAPAAPVDETPYGRGVDRAGVASVPAEPGRTITYRTVRIDPDRWILPAGSATLDGADAVADLPIGVAVEQTSPGNLLFREQTDHDAILSNGQFLLLLDALLGAPSG